MITPAPQAGQSYNVTNSTLFVKEMLILRLERGVYMADSENILRHSELFIQPFHK